MTINLKRKLFDPESICIGIFILWIMLPVFIMLLDIPIYYSLPEKFREISIAKAWYEPAYGRVLVVLGYITILTVLFVMLFYLRKRKAKGYFGFLFKPWYALLGALLGWSIICTLASEYPAREWVGTEYRQEGLRTYFFYAAVLLGASFISRPVIKIQLIKTYVFVAVSMSALILCQNYKVPVISSIFGYKNAAVFFNTNHCAYYLTMSILCTLGLNLYENQHKMSVTYTCLFAIQYFALLKNNTFGCFLAVWGGIFFVYLLFIYRGNKIDNYRLAPLIVFALVTASCWNIVVSNIIKTSSDVSNVMKNNDSAGRAGSGRIALWRQAIVDISKRPILGYGPEGIAYYYPERYNNRPHNEYLQYAVFTGIPGMFFYLAALITLARDRIKKLKDLDSASVIIGGAIIGYCISAFFGVTMLYTAIYFFMFLGLIATDSCVIPTEL